MAACPWNKFARAASEAKLKARADLEAPTLAELLRHDDAGFRALFTGSPVKRIGRDRFIRNVLIAIGNSGEANLAGEARRLLADASPLVRGAAVWALSQLIARDEFTRRRRAPAASPTSRCSRSGARQPPLDFIAAFPSWSPTMTNQPFFTRHGDGFMPTSVANGPWSPESMHGRVVIGLLGFAIEERHGSDDFVPARLTVDMFRLPNITTPVEVRAKLVSDGFHIKVIEAEFLSGGQQPHPPRSAMADPLALTAAVLCSIQMVFG